MLKQLVKTQDIRTGRKLEISFVCLYVGRTHTASEIHIVFIVYEHNEDGISIGRRERHGIT